MTKDDSNKRASQGYSKVEEDVNHTQEGVTKETGVNSGLSKGISTFGGSSGDNKSKTMTNTDKDNDGRRQSQVVWKTEGCVKHPPEVTNEGSDARAANPGEWPPLTKGKVSTTVAAQSSIGVKGVSPSTTGATKESMATLETGKKNQAPQEGEEDISNLYQAGS
jgi:hypothetical protein